MTPLEAELRRIIAADGPMSVATYMALCLGHPAHGYYMTRDPFGRAGDFITAPEISQMFGELIGLWAVAVWQMMGAPAPVALVELGPGRGTLMADALRAARAAPAFAAALEVHLVETSPHLQRRQQEALAALDVPISWHPAFAAVPRRPLIVIANEFFDALPVHQAVKTPRGWHERMVGVGADGQLTFALHPDPLPGFATIAPEVAASAPAGAVYEWRSGGPIDEIASRVAKDGGAALVIDYGHGEGALGETLQAVGRHGFADPLATPGAVDLTAHVDFAALARTAKAAGARAHGPVSQRDFLRRLGIEARAAALRANASAAQAADIAAALARLTGPGRESMGELFEAVVFADPRLGALPGFDS
ncbi:MAG TPA: SAM-dependent methyltransferase [Xanthobacteraceae bacterium]|nr:SAM-dependent methyltransferase [Xanthobacteraceae bacterium]